jgi:hypothetical protein
VDPAACLDLASMATDGGDYEAALEHLDDYRTWRLRGGFEPRGGDEHARSMRRRIFDDREPPEPDGEDFRGGEAAAYEAEQMAAWQRLK